MRKTRREFLAETTLGVAAGVVAFGTAAATIAAQDPSQQQPAGAPPAFGTGPAVGPEVTPGTFAEAEKLVQIQMSEQERAQAATSWRGNMASLYERRTGPTENCAGGHAGAVFAIPECHAGTKSSDGKESIRAKQSRSRAFAGERRRHCVCASDASCRGGLSRKS